MARQRVPAEKARSPATIKPRAPRGHPPAAGGLLGLQREVGNASVGAILQAKLRVNKPGDRYEQEADRVADAVMRMPDPLASGGGVGAVGGGNDIGVVEADGMSTSKRGTSTSPLAITPVQRMCADCEDEMQREPMEEEEPLQAKDASGGSAVAGQIVSPTVEGRISSMQGGGRPLAKETRAYFEPRFGRSFARVRVHTGTQAATVARSVNARAFTVGSNVVFGAGEYAPRTDAGRRLLGHELVHTIQQSRGTVATQVLAREAEEPCPPDCMVSPVPPGCPVSCDIDGSDIKEPISECPSLPNPSGEWATEPWLCEMRQETPGSNRRLLAVGARGRSVELLHQVLQNWICDGHTTKRLSNSHSRVYDGSTREVVREYQRWAGVAADGIVGPITLWHAERRALDSHVGGPFTSAPCNDARDSETENDPVEPPVADPCDLQLTGFARRSSSTAWPKLDRATLATEMRARIKDPRSVNQSVLNVCGPAAIVHLLLIHNPCRYVDIVADLFETGKATLDGEELAPGGDLRGNGPPSSMAQVDWMLMSAMRDCANAVLDFEGTADEDFSGITTPSELEDWMKSVLQCQTADWMSAYLFGEIDILQEAGDAVKSGKAVALLIDAAMFTGSDLKSKKKSKKLGHPNHWVILKSDVVKNGDKLSFTVWTWGESTNRKLSLDEAFAERTFYGASICEL